MLRSEHVMARLSRGRLVPHRLSTEDEKAIKVADSIVRVYEEHVGRTRSSLDAALSAMEEEVGPVLDVRRGFRIVRALGKLLEERAEWATPTTTDPYTLRTRVFELASELSELPALESDLLDSPTLDDVLERVASEVGLSNAETVTTLMYSDRQSAQALAEFSIPTAEAVISRYNVAQVQGVLYAAKDLTVDLGAEADARLVFHYVKKMGLIHSIEPLRGGYGGYRLHLDGPLSLFGSTRKYGLRLAKFLPGLILTSPWRLSANVEWKNRNALLELDSEKSGFASHYLGPKTDEEQDEIVASFQKAWERARDTGDWKLEESSKVISVPELESAFVPDFTLTNAGTKEIVHLEILGFWTKRNLVDRTKLIAEISRRGDRVLVAASEKLGASDEALAEGTRSGVIPFKGKLAVKDVLSALNAPDDSGDPF